MYFDASDEKFVILNLSHKISVNANNVAELYGRRSSILSFVIEEKNGGEKLRNFPLKLDLKNFIFSTHVQKQLYKQYESVLNPEKHLQKKLLEKEYEIERSKDQQRTEYKRQIDQVRDKTSKRKLRDQTEERRSMHKRIDQERDQTMERRDMHNNVDHVRDQTAERKLRDRTKERKEMHAIIDQDRDQTEERKACTRLWIK